MDVITAIGPASDLLPNTVLEGYSPVNRNGEVTQTAFIDAFEFNYITHTADDADATNPSIDAGGVGLAAPILGEQPPAFHEWASVQPGFLCVSAKNRSHNYRNHIAAETAAPVIACAQLLTSEHDKKYFFAGVARTKSVRDYDDVANGPKRDEFFTLHIGGPVTILNNGGSDIHNGDLVEWTFLDDLSSSTAPTSKRPRVGPRRIQVRRATGTHARVFGRALSFAKRGEPLDVLVGYASM